jgi:biotin operon repressor
VLQESIDHLKRSGFEVERTTTGYTFTLESKKRLDLNIGKNECEVIQKIDAYLV